MKILDSKVHGVIDYALDVLLVAAPTIFGFSQTAASICYVVAAVHFLTSLNTKYELSLFKLIPFPVHGTIELAAAIGLTLMPWIAGFTEDVAARNFFVVTGAAVFLVWLTTDYRSKERIGVSRNVDMIDEIPFRNAA